MHEQYWKAVCDAAHGRLDRLMMDCGHDVAGIVGDDDGIDSFADAKKVLSHALRCADSHDEEACAVLSVAEALFALHELREHSDQAGA